MMQQAQFQCGYVAVDILGFDNERMVKTRLKAKTRRRLFIKEWRKHRRLTQEQLADRVEMSVSNISQLEQGRQGYSQEGLEAIADALNCDPGQLLNVDPTKGDAIWSLWERAKPGERKIIIDVAQSIVGKTGTND